DGRDIEPAQVEIEPRQALRRGRVDGRSAVQATGRGIVAQIQRIVGDVVSTVAGEREKRVAEAGRPGDQTAGRPRRCGRRKGGHPQRRRGGPDRYFSQPRRCHGHPPWWLPRASPRLPERAEGTAVAGRTLITRLDRRVRARPPYAPSRALSVSCGRS